VVTEPDEPSAWQAGVSLMLDEELVRSRNIEAAWRAVEAARSDQVAMLVANRLLGWAMREGEAS
jgi:hypothetical protein